MSIRLPRLKEEKIKILNYLASWTQVKKGKGLTRITETHQFGRLDGLKGHRVKDAFKLSKEIDDLKCAIERREENVRLILSFVFMKTYLDLFKFRVIFLVFLKSKELTQPSPAISSCKKLVKTCLNLLTIQIVIAYAVLVLLQGFICFQSFSNKLLLTHLAIFCHDKWVGSKMTGNFRRMANQNECILNFGYLFQKGKNE